MENDDLKYKVTRFARDTKAEQLMKTDQSVKLFGQMPQLVMSDQLYL